MQWMQRGPIIDNLLGQGQAVHPPKCNHRCQCQDHHDHVQFSPIQPTQSKHRWIPLPMSGSDMSKKWNWKESLQRDFRWAQKLALTVSVSLASLGRGVFGICLPRDSYFEFGSLGTHWPSGLPHRHLPPPSIRVSSRTASEWYLLIPFLFFHCCFKCPWNLFALSF